MRTTHIPVPDASVCMMNRLGKAKTGALVIAHLRASKAFWVVSFQQKESFFRIQLEEIVA